MIICTKCGTDNPLGRVFCGKCGSKLDLKDMTSDKVVENIEVSWWSIHGKKIIILIVLILLTPLGLALWPSTQPIGKAGDASKEGVLATKIRQVAAMRAGQAYSFAFPEDEVNGYAAARAAALGYKSLSIQVTAGATAVRAVKPLAVTISGKQYLNLPMSVDIMTVPGTPSGFMATSVKMGHMPMFGPLKGLAVGIATKSLVADKDVAVLSSPGEVKMEDGLLTVVYRK